MVFYKCNIYHKKLDIIKGEIQVNSIKKNEKNTFSFSNTK